MLGRKNIVQCGMILLGLVTINESSGFCKELSGDDPQIISFGSDSLSGKKKPYKTKATKATKAKKDTAKVIETTVNADNGVVITNSGIENLKDDEVFVEETHIKREFVLEEDFKLWRIYVQKGRKMTDYRKIEVPFGTFYKKNQMDITEEMYNLETKDLPEGETKRYKRDEYEAREREKINEEIRKHYEFKVIPADSTNQNNSTNQDTQNNQR
jgi:hypothetical protein